MAVTIKDVALRARVSIASVSRALHGTGHVTEQTRLRVERAAQQLRYTPHVAARSLITRRTQTVGVLLPDIFGEYFSELIRGIDSVAKQKRLHLLVTSSHGDAREAAVALRAMNGRVDGVVVMSPYVDLEVIASTLPAALPWVLLNAPASSGEINGFAIDDYGGARAVVDHLLQEGHSRVAHVSGPEGNYESAERLRGFHDALAAAGKTAAAVIGGAFTEESGYAAGKQLASMRGSVDAVFAANDTMAVGCLQAFRDTGLAVPDDIALAGFDDIPIARYVSPPLTTVRSEITALGRLALEALVETINAPLAASPARRVLATQLVVRASSRRR